jgi:hypothetical protein
MIMIPKWMLIFETKWACSVFWISLNP